MLKLMQILEHVKNAKYNLMTNQARSSLYLAEHRHHWAACWGPWESHMGIPGEDRWAGRRFPCIQVLQPPRYIYGLQYPVYMCSPLHAIPNPLVWWKYMCNNNPASPPHPRLLLLLSRQSSSFNACNRGPQSTNSLGSLLLGDRLHRYIQYGRGANTQ